MSAKPARSGAPKVTAPVDEVDPIARRMLPALRRMVRDEVEQLRVPAPRVAVARPDAEIMNACRRVAEACDELDQAKFAGVREVAARQKLIRAAWSLKRAMKKHGRMPGGEG